MVNDGYQCEIANYHRSIEGFVVKPGMGMLKVAGITVAFTNFRCIGVECQSMWVWRLVDGRWKGSYEKEGDFPVAEMKDLKRKEFYKENEL